MNNNCLQLIENYKKLFEKKGEFDLVVNDFGINKVKNIKEIINSIKNIKLSIDEIPGMTSITIQEIVDLIGPSNVYGLEELNNLKENLIHRADGDKDAIEKINKYYDLDDIVVPKLPSRIQFMRDFEFFKKINGNSDHNITFQLNIPGSFRNLRSVLKYFLEKSGRNIENKNWYKELGNEHIFKEKSEASWIMSEKYRNQNVNNDMMYNYLDVIAYQLPECIELYEGNKDFKEALNEFDNYLKKNNWGDLSSFVSYSGHLEPDRKFRGSINELIAKEDRFSHELTNLKISKFMFLNVQETTNIDANLFLRMGEIITGLSNWTNQVSSDSRIVASGILLEMHKFNPTGASNHNFFRFFKKYK